MAYVNIQQGCCPCMGCKCIGDILRGGQHTGPLPAMQSCIWGNPTHNMRLVMPMVTQHEACDAHGHIT